MDTKNLHLTILYFPFFLFSSVNYMVWDVYSWFCNTFSSIPLVSVYGFGTPFFFFQV